MIKLMAMETISILMELCLLDIGNWISSMDRELKLGLIMLSIVGIMRWGRSKEGVNFSGLMVRVMKGIFMIIISVGMELIFELMEGSIQDSEKIIKWKEMEFSHDQMAENTQANT